MPQSQTNRNVFSAHLNRSVDKSAERREDRRLFQILDPSSSSSETLVVECTVGTLNDERRSIRQSKHAPTEVRSFSKTVQNEFKTKLQHQITSCIQVVNQSSVWNYSLKLKLQQKTQSPTVIQDKSNTDVLFLEFFQDAVWVEHASIKHLAYIRSWSRCLACINSIHHMLHCSTLYNNNNNNNNNNLYFS